MRTFGCCAMVGPRCCSKETKISSNLPDMDSLTQDQFWDGSWYCPEHLAQIDPRTEPYYGAIRQMYNLLDAKKGYCPECGQIDQGQTGECPCPVCGLPQAWDEEEQS